MLQSRIFRFIAAGLLLLGFSTVALADNLASAVDRTQLGIDETVNLRIVYAGDGDPDDLNINDLSQDFEILQQGSSSSVRIANGSISKDRQWQFIIRPRKMGKIVIPSFKIGKTFSDAIVLDVSATAAPANGQTTGDSTLTVTIEPDTGYVQQQRIMTLDFATPLPIREVAPETPAIPGVLVEDLGFEKQIEYRNGVRYMGVKQRFALFPQRSGTLEIPVMHLRYAVEVPMNNPFSSTINQRSTQNYELHTDAKTIEVQPAPDNFIGKKWLPAKHYTIQDKTSANVKQMIAGTPLTWTVTQNANGLKASQLPPIEIPEIPGLRFYRDNPVTDDTASATGITSTHTDSIVIVADHAGDFTLPALEMTWWDTVTGQPHTTTLPARSLHVEPNPAAPVVAPPPTAAAPALAAPAATTPPADTTPPLSPLPALKVATPWWLVACGALMLMLLTMGSVYSFVRHRRRVANLAPDPSQDEAALWQQLAGHCTQQTSASATDLISLRTAILQWARVFWQDDEISSLSQVAALAPDMHSLLSDLDKSLYSQARQHKVDLPTLLSTLSETRNQGLKKIRITAGNSLKKLYKNT